MQVQRQLVVDRPAVATDDAGDRLAQQGLKAREISPEVNHEKGHCRGRRSRASVCPPSPSKWSRPCSSPGPHGPPPEPLIRTGQGSTRLPFQAETEPREVGTSKTVPMISSTPRWPLMTAAQVRHHRGQAWPDDMGANLRWDLATIEVATARAGACVSLVFGDVGRQLGEFGNLMPGRLGVTGGFRGQGSLAVGADHRHVRHDLVDPLGRKRWRWCPGCPGCPPGLRPVGVLMTGLGAPGGSTEGGEEEFDELRFSWERSSWISACKSAICLRALSNCPRASFKAARSLPHSGQEATGLARGSFIYYKDTEVARNCNVFNDHQSLSRIIDARRGTGRLRIQIRAALEPEGVLPIGIAFMLAPVFTP